MRTPLPASCGAFRFHFSVFDIGWAFASPLAALYLSNAYVMSSADGTRTVILYSAVSAASACVAFLVFRFQASVPRYFSVSDALAISKAVVFSELLTCIVLFSLIRLDGIPRSTPIIHAVILGAGLVAVRAATRLLADSRITALEQNAFSEHIIMVGANQLTSLYIKLLKACDPSNRHVVGVLDRRPNMIGRMMEGVKIVGEPEYLKTLVDEYLVHGVKVDRVVIGGGEDLLPEDEITKIHGVCADRNIGLDFVPQLFGLANYTPGVSIADLGKTNEQSDHTVDDSNHTVDDNVDLVPSAYFRYKPAIDFSAALILLVVLIPMLLTVSLMVLLDVGSPVLFWQRRLGLKGRKFLLYKFRTLRTPFNARGQEIPADQRLSWVGHLLRDTGLDELPQLLNVLVGDMSLIGPRPLLPEDQPVNSAGRLLVRPGITGWAQVNGGKFLTAEEKVTLDEWYVQNASLWVDIVLVWRTLKIARLGARRSNEAIVGPGKKEPVEHWQNESVS